MTRIASVAIVGAGLAGLACAAALRHAGLSVTLFDKGRRPGGRIATRRVDGVSFDHGAQYATARDPAFQAVMADLAQAGAAAPWPAADTPETRWVGTPGMSALPRHLADKLTEAGAALHMDRHVAFLHAAGTAGRPAWSLRHLPAGGTKPGAVAAEGGEVTEKKFDAVLLALPAPQAVNLLAAIAHPHAAALASVAFAPCWTAMAAFDAPIPGPDIFRPTHAPLGWAAREGSRPGHAAAPDAPTVDAWVLQATGAWSREHLEQPAGEVAATLLATFLALASRPSAAPRHLSAHRWRYALVEKPLGTPCLWDPATAIGVCGDFCLAPRVEAAWQSGTALASAVLSHN